MECRRWWLNKEWSVGYGVCCARLLSIPVARDVFLADQAANSLGRRRDSNIQISKPVTSSDSD